MCVLQGERKEDELREPNQSFPCCDGNYVIYAQQTDYIKIYVDLRLTAKRERKQFPGM